MSTDKPIAKPYMIPDEALDSHMGILGKTGSGKTYTAKGAVERLLTKKRHTVIIDPTGAWKGLRTLFDIPIFGGLHGDIEINDKAGRAVADVIIRQNTSAIIDLSQMTGAAQTRFMYAFAATLRQKPDGALYLVIDEADEFMPQYLGKDQTHMFAELKWIVRRGRRAGFRVMMITQRPASVGSMAEVLLSVYPNYISRDRLAEEIGMAPTGGGFNNKISAMNVAGLMEKGPDGGYRLSDDVMKAQH